VLDTLTDKFLAVVEHLDAARADIFAVTDFREDWHQEDYSH
jgi:hypothetical protein